MNRFKNYLESQRLTKMFLVAARELNDKGKTLEALSSVIRALSHQVTACNNIASLYFERRKKR